MSLRDTFALHAPIDFKCAVECFGSETNLGSDQGRAAFFALWARIRYEYADAMLAEREERDKTAA